MDEAVEKIQPGGKVAWWHWHRHLYNWVIHFADTKHGERALFLLSFAESSFFPVPPDVLLAPLALGAPKKWVRNIRLLYRNVSVVDDRALGIRASWGDWTDGGEFCEVPELV
jgi:hypothetical protein